MRKRHGSRFKLRQAAKNDLKEIGRYTLKNYGQAQRDKYLKGLEQRFKLLGGKILVLGSPVRMLKRAIIVAITKNMRCSIASERIL